MVRAAAPGWGGCPHHVAAGGSLTAVRTWGIDWSTSAKNTAAVCTSWSGTGKASITRVEPTLGRTAAVKLIVGAVEAGEWVAVDVPFGWPTQFVEMVTQHQARRPIKPPPAAATSDAWRTDQLAIRATDRRVMAETKDRGKRIRPLSVAFDKLGATALSWAVVEEDLRSYGVQIDRSGMSGQVVETYPKAARVMWHGAAPPDPAEFLTRLDWLDQGAFAAQLSGPGNHVFDALVCSLVARARATDTTTAPAGEEILAAEREGWIHLPLNPVHELTG